MINDTKTYVEVSLKVGPKLETKIVHVLNRRRGQISSTPTQPRDRLEYNLDEREDNGDRTWRTSKS